MNGGIRSLKRRGDASPAGTGPWQAAPGHAALGGRHILVRVVDAEDEDRTAVACATVTHE